MTDVMNDKSRELNKKEEQKDDKQEHEVDTTFSTNMQTGQFASREKHYQSIIHKTTQAAWQEF